MMTAKKSLLVVILGIFCWVAVTLSTPAQTGNLRLESRVDRLESELSRVRSQITRLEAQIANPNRPIPNTPLPSPHLPPNELSLEEQFDNLAILTIELKQQVQQLENRVEVLEQR
jgi:hypothetical protein